MGSENLKRFFYLTLGILFVSISLFFLILYLNLFTFGYNMQKYVYFISSRIECLIGLIGILLIVVSLKKKG